MTGAKLYELAIAKQVLSVADPVFGFPIWLVLSIVSIIEISVIAGLIIMKNDIYKYVALLWLSSCFLVYQAGKVWLGAKEPCACFGRLLEWLPAPLQLHRLLSFTISFFFFFGSLIFLCELWLQSRSTTRTTKPEATNS
jgi:hypothetical protein